MVESELRSEGQMGEDRMNLRLIRTRIIGKWRERQFKKFLNSFDTSDDLLEFINKKHYHSTLSHIPSDEIRGKRFKLLFEKLKIDFTNASFLDLGPGSGESLDVACGAGASTVEFVDYDPYLMAFLILRGFNGYMINYLIPPGLAQLYPKKYDVILSKGSINGDRFNRKERGLILFPEWIEQVENLANPGCHIIICPTFDKGTETYGKSYYVCSDPEAFENSWFSQVLKERGYKIIYVESFNNPKRFPFTFYRRKLNE